MYVNIHVWSLELRRKGSEMHMKFTGGADEIYGFRPGYVITADLVYEIAAGAAMKPNNHRLFKLEDIAMGSWIDFIQEEKGIRVRYARSILRSVLFIPWYRHKGSPVD